MTKIEGVARAICELYGQSPSFNWQKYEATARAAIAAMRIKGAGWNEDDGSPLTTLSDIDWNERIDAALKEEQT